MGNFLSSLIDSVPECYQSSSNSSARYSPCQTFPIAESIDVTTERYLATFIPAFPSCLCYLRECLWPSSSSTHFIRNQTSSLLLHWGKHSNSKAREKIWYLWIHILHRLADVPLLAQLQIQYIARSCKAFFRELAMFASSSFPLCSGCQSNLWATSP